MVIIMKNINTQQLLKILSNITLIDIRSPQEFNRHHLIGAKNIPYNQLNNSFNQYLNKNVTYYIICNKGHNSQKLCNKLSNLGFNVVNVIGGMSALSSNYF